MAESEIAPKFAPFFGMAALMEGLQSLIPVVMAGIIAVYSLVIAVLIAGSMDPSKKYSLFKYVRRLRE
ncbi:MAG: hypothetical protein LQ338_001638 [Usnochroma carphineum]|nr:MAG: hypothetical protein LQ338_001638 [Usnochroma carphineum]